MLEKWLPDQSVILPLETPQHIINDEGADETNPNATQSCAHGAPVWDAVALAKRIGDDPVLREQLLNKFQNRTQTHLEAMHFAALTGDIATVGKLAHTLKGSAHTMGAMPLASYVSRWR